MRAFPYTSSPLADDTCHDELCREPSSLRFLPYDEARHKSMKRSSAVHVNIRISRLPSSSVPSQYSTSSPYVSGLSVTSSRLPTDRALAISAGVRRWYTYVAQMRHSLLVKHGRRDIRQFDIHLPNILSMALDIVLFRTLLRLYLSTISPYPTTPRMMSKGIMPFSANQRGVIGPHTQIGDARGSPTDSVPRSDAAIMVALFGANPV